MDLAESLGHRLPSEQRHPWEEARFEFIMHLIGETLTLNTGDIVVDIGCGDAYVTEQLAACFPDAKFYAVDPAFTDEFLERHRATAQPNILFFRTTNELADKLREQTATLILLTDVIEHIEDDAAFLRSLCRQKFCAATTHLLITVPAFQSLNTARDKALGHFRRYTNASLRALLSKSGLRDLSHGYFFFSLVGVRLLRVIGERMFGSKKSNETDLLTWRKSSFATRAALALLRTDLLIMRALRRIGINPIGLSNYCICIPNVNG